MSSPAAQMKQAMQREGRNWGDFAKWVRTHKNGYCYCMIQDPLEYWAVVHDKIAIPKFIQIPENSRVWHALGVVFVPTYTEYAKAVRDMNPAIELYTYEFDGPAPVRWLASMGEERRKRSNSWDEATWDEAMTVNPKFPLTLEK